MAIEKGARHHVIVKNWEDLTTSSKAVTLTMDYEDDGKMDITIDLQNGMTGEDVEAAIVAKGRSTPSFFALYGVLLVIGFASALGFGLFIGGTEVGKLALISLFLPLYTRIRKENVLDNETRGMIRGYIIANPGDNYNSIKRALGLNNGALAHHLRVLERAGVVRSRQDGMFKRFYPAGMKIPRENGGEISEIQRILLGKVAESPGISQKEMGILLGLSKGVINYHVKVLLGKQLIKVIKKGRKTQCFLQPGAGRFIRDANYGRSKEV
jgi:predicted transcriptional regulator